MDRDAAREKVIADIRESITKHGFQCLHIFPTADEPKHASFNYTVGLRERGLPELIVFALPPEAGHCTISNAVEIMLRQGAPADGYVSDEIANMPTVFRSIDPVRACQEHMRFSRSYYGDLPPSTMQLIWPDQKGRFPWQAGSNRKLHKMQCEIVDWCRAN